MKKSEQELANWLAHPLEFGEPPLEVNEIHQEETSWLLIDEQVSLSFHRYIMKDGFSSVGMTGPITWSFLGDDLSDFSMEDLKRLYAGWHISFMAINSANYSKEENDKKQQATAEILTRTVDGFSTIIEYLSFGELAFYAYEYIRDNHKFVVATDRENQSEFGVDSKYLRFPLLYYFLGSLFFEGKL
ncbi:MAG: hypothetical protein R2911_32960 [Caldilineaceae bacterium]